MSDSYDLVVIGAGSGGVRAARVAANHGARVAIVEEYRVGGTCVIRGCVPKKLFVYGARFADLFEIAPSFGWTVDASFDWATLVANKDKEIARLEAAYVAGLEAPGAEVIRDRAVLTGPKSVKLLKSGRELEARHILVATGGHPFVPDIPGKELGITSNEAFDLEKLPHSILIEGGGYIAAEFATIFSRLGVNTTIVYRGQTDPARLRRRPLRRARGRARGGGHQDHLPDRRPRAAKERQRHHRELLRRRRCAVRRGDVRHRPPAQRRRASGSRRSASQLGEDGAIKVDAYSQTSIPSIHAVGDVTNRAQLTPVAIREGQAFADTVFGGRPTAVDHSLIGTAVFSEPELATVGLTERDAATHGDVDVYVTRFRPMINTLSLKSERMVMKLVTQPDEREGARRPHPRPRRRRDDPDGRHSARHGRHQGRLRPRHRHAPDGGRGAGDVQEAELCLSGRGEAVARAQPAPLACPHPSRPAAIHLLPQGEKGSCHVVLLPLREKVARSAG